MNLTEMEKDVIIALVTSDYADGPGDAVWSWDIADNVKITKQNQISGIVSSLSKKGLVKSDCGELGKYSCTWLTEKGVEVYKSLMRD